MVTRMAGNRSSISPQERITVAFIANGRGSSMSGDNEGVIIESQQAVSDRRKNLGLRAAPQISPANAVQEKCIAGKKNVSLACIDKRRAAGSVPRSVNHSNFQTGAGDRLPIVQIRVD